jgi:uncharacterized protein YutE (UPF0331/DUF86 family)
MVDDEILVDKLRYVNEYTSDLKEMRGMSQSDYVDDIVTQRAVERTLMNLIQACIDIAQHVRSSEGLEPGGTAKDDVRALGEVGVLSAETEEKLVEAVGFRNVLAHRYGEIDHEVVYDVLHEDLRWFEEFQQEVAEWLQSRREE